MGSAFEALAKAACVACGVAINEPEELSVTVGEGTFGGFKDDVFDLAGLVEDQEEPVAFVMEPGEGLWFGLRPWDHVDPPSAFSGGILGKEGGGLQFKVLADDWAQEVEPFAKLGPGFGLELDLGIGGDDPTAIGEGDEGPQDQLRHCRRLGDAVTGGGSFEDGTVHR